MYYKMTFRKILLIFFFLSNISCANAELVPYGDNLQFDKDSILILKNPTRVTFTIYYNLEDNKFYKSNIVVNCSNQTFYSNGLDSYVDQNLKYISSVPISTATPTKDNPSDLTKYSLPHVMYLMHCLKKE